MENDIVKGIAAALRRSFGSAYRVYQDNVEQSLQTPCFFILPLQVTPSPLGRDRFLLRSPFDIHFFPEEETQNALMQKTAWQMWQALEFISLPDGSLLHGTSVTWEVQDGVLHFFTSFNMTLRRADIAEKMYELYIKEGPANGRA